MIENHRTMKDTTQPRFFVDKLDILPLTLLVRIQRNIPKERKKRNNITGEETKRKNRDVIGQEIRKEKDKKHSLRS